MKQLSILSLAAILLLSSCGMMLPTGGTTAADGTTVAATTNPQTAYSAGQALGNVISTLFTQYKTNGTINLKDPTTLLSLASAASSYAQVKQAMKDPNAQGNAIQGLIAGSNKSVNNTSSANNILSLLGNIDLTQFIGTKAGEYKIPEKKQTEIQNTLEELFKNMK